MKRLFKNWISRMYNKHCLVEETQDWDPAEEAFISNYTNTIYTNLKVNKTEKFEAENLTTISLILNHVSTAFYRKGVSDGANASALK